MVVALIGIVLFLLLVLFGVCAYIRWQMQWPNIAKSVALVFGKDTAKSLSQLIQLKAEKELLALQAQKRGINGG